MPNAYCIVAVGKKSFASVPPTTDFDEYDDDDDDDDDENVDGFAQILRRDVA